MYIHMTLHTAHVCVLYGVCIAEIAYIQNARELGSVWCVYTAKEYLLHADGESAQRVAIDVEVVLHDRNNNKLCLLQDWGQEGLMRSCLSRVEQYIL